MEICPKCGLPIQACVCQDISKSEQKIKVETIKRKYGKIITLVSGFKNLDIKSAQKLMFGSFVYLPIVQLVLLFNLK